MRHKEIVDGTWVTMITPFKPDYTIDYSGVEALIDWYIQKGVDGIFAVCQSSEMFFLSLRERLELADFIAQKTAGRIPIVISGHVSEALHDQIEELTAMARLQPQAVVIVSNRFAKEHEPDEVWIENAKKVLEAIPDTNFGIYECPYPYKRLLSPKVLQWCASTGRFSFIKDTCCDEEQLQEKIDILRGTGIKLFNANSATLLSSLRMGAAGFCGVMLNFHPELYGWLCKNWKENPAEAERLQHFATTASLIELQLYPTNAKYHMMLDGVPIGVYTRSKDDRQFGRLKRMETEHLYKMWQEFAKP